MMGLILNMLTLKWPYEIKMEHLINSWVHQWKGGGKTKAGDKDEKAANV